MSYSVAISVFFGVVGGRAWGGWWLLSGSKGRKHRSPHELCGRICYCSWPPKSKDNFCLFANFEAILSRESPVLERRSRGQKRHINIWHINNFSVTRVTGPPGRVPDPPGRVPGRKCLCSLGSAHSTWTFYPWPPVGWPLATRSGDPPHPGSHRKNLFMFMCLFLSSRRLLPQRTLLQVRRPLFYSGFRRKKAEERRWHRTTTAKTLSRSTLWHEIATKIIPWELFFRNFEAILYPQILRERRTFSRKYAWDSEFFQHTYFKINFFVSNNFASGGRTLATKHGQKKQ